MNPKKATVYCVVESGGDKPLFRKIPRAEVERMKGEFDHHEAQSEIPSVRVAFFFPSTSSDERRWERALRRMASFPPARPHPVRLEGHDADFNPVYLWMCTKPFASITADHLLVPEPTSLGILLSHLKPSECEQLKKKMPRLYLRGLAEAVQET
jgi:hypothetical protein